MEHKKSLDKFSDFATGQFKTETKVWPCLFLIIALFYGVTTFVFDGALVSPEGILSTDQILSIVAQSAGIFLFLYGLHLVCLFIWYVIIFWLLRRFPAIRRERFETQH